MDKPYFLTASSGTLHIKGCCPQSRDVQANMGEFFYTESDVWKKKGLTFKWCHLCLGWRENVVRQALQQKEETK